jgi:hypothetical protein
MTCNQEALAERNPAGPFAWMSRPRLEAFELHHQQKADVLPAEGLAFGAKSQIEPDRTLLISMSKSL